MVKDVSPSAHPPEDGLEKIRLLHPGRAHSQADVWLVRRSGQLCVLRDYSPPRPRFWRWICSWAVRRELIAHRLLEGVPGVPGLIDVLDDRRYLIEYIDGVSLNRRLHQLTPEFFDRLRRTLDAMHERKVAHSDLRNRNILVGPDQTPFVIDLTTAWWGTSWWRVPLFRLLVRIDDRRFAVSKARFCPNALDPIERKRVETDPLLIRVGRIYRKKIYPLLPLRKRKKD